MATRPVFEPILTAPYYTETNIDFAWSHGQYIGQKRKNITALHNGFLAENPCKRILEISSKSESSEGVALSAMNLTFTTKDHMVLYVENAYQGSKVFEHGGPYTDMYDMSPMRAKQDERLHSSGHVVSFSFEGKTYSIEHYDAFYNWIYIRALSEHYELALKALDYDAYTDIAYTPSKGTSCQARAMAIFASLIKIGRLDVVRSYEDFTEFVYGDPSRVRGPVCKGEDAENKFASIKRAICKLQEDLTPSVIPKFKRLKCEFEEVVLISIGSYLKVQAESKREMRRRIIQIIKCHTELDNLNPGELSDALLLAQTICKELDVAVAIYETKPGIDGIADTIMKALSDPSDNLEI